MTFPPTGWARRAVRPTSRPTAPITRRPALWVEALESRLVPTGRPLPLPIIYAGTGEGPPPLVRAFDAETGALNFERLAADPSFAGGVRVATADITRDGFPDLVTALGPGGQPVVRVLDGKTGDPVPGPLGEFMAYAPEFTGGVQVAAADVDGDTIPDVITGAGAGGGPHVKAFSGATGEVIRSFFAFEPDFAGGVSLAAADFTGDGRADLAVGAGVGGGPRVRVFDMETGAPVAGPLGDFFAFDPAARSGVSVAADALAGDVDADGVPDLAVGTGPGVSSLIRVFSGATGGVVRELGPFDPGMTAGVTVGLNYADDDEFADVVAGTGPGVPVTVRVFSGATGLPVALPTSEFQPFGPDAVGGVNLAASNDPAILSVQWITDAIEPESSGGSGVVGKFRITVAGGSPMPFTVNYTLSGTATAGGDYITPGGISIYPTQTFYDVAINPKYDISAEGMESVTLTLSSGSGYTLGSPSTATLRIDDPIRLAPTLDVAIPVNANNDNGSAWKPGQKFIPAVRDFDATNLAVNDPQLKPLAVTVGWALGGRLDVWSYAPGEGTVNFWNDQKKNTSFTWLNVPAGQNPTTVTVFVEGTHESTTYQDVQIFTRFTPADRNGALMPPVLAKTVTGTFTVTPVINSFATEIPNPSMMVLADGLQAQGPIPGVTGLFAPGIKFKANVRTTNDQSIRYVQNILNEVNGANAGGAGLVRHSPPSGERLYDVILDPNSGAAFPLLDTPPTQDANADPTYPSFTDVWVPPEPSSQVYIATDSPAFRFTVNPELTKRIDIESLFKMYLVVRYADGTLYPIANWGWSANFYGGGWVEGRGLTVVGLTGGVIVDSPWARSNDDPAKTVPPVAATVYTYREIT